MLYCFTNKIYKKRKSQRKCLNLSEKLIGNNVINVLLYLWHIGHNVPIKDTFKHFEDGTTRTTCTNGYIGTGDPEATETDSSGKLIFFV